MYDIYMYMYVYIRIEDMYIYELLIEKGIKYIREILYIEIDKSSFLLIERKVYI